MTGNTSAANMTIEDLKRKFIEIYGGTEEEIRVFSSPGRVNLIGEHTDYNGGYVFPAALTLSSTVVARPRDDRMMNLIATDLGVQVRGSLDRLDEYKTLKWGNYQYGVADELQKAGYELTGCDLLYHDTVPLGAGLSSSAAIEVATAVALVSLGNTAHGLDQPLDMIRLALICQKAENNYVGVNCGIMDQFASAMGKKDHAIFLNCRDLSYRHVPLNLKGYRIVIANTNKKRAGRFQVQREKEPVRSRFRDPQEIPARSHVPWRNNNGRVQQVQTRDKGRGHPEEGRTRDSRGRQGTEVRRSAG